MRPLPANQTWPAAGGDTAERVRKHDWATTGLGPVETWSPALRSTVDLVLTHGFPMVALWGPDLIQIYNDGYRALMGSKHPAGLGQPTHACWPEVRLINQPIYERVLAGETLTFEDKLYPLNRHGPPEDAWFSLTYSPVRDEGRIAGVLVTVFETTERVLADRARDAAEASKRESEQRQAFLLQLTDALRPLADPVAAQEVAARMLGENLQVDRCYYAEFDWPNDVLYINQEYVRSAAVSAIGQHPISAFQDLLQFSHKGDPLVCDNIATHPIFKSEIAAYRERGTDGFILMPLVKQGIMVACMCVTMEAPRAWSNREVTLVEDVAERTWSAVERARAEAALRESEERLRQFGEASQDVLWIRDAETLQWQYLTLAFETIYGLPRTEALSGDNYRSWLDLVVPEDRTDAAAAIARVRAGEHVTFEYRVRRPADGAIRWLRNTDFPIAGPDGEVALIGGVGQDVTEFKLAQLRLEQGEERLRSAVEVGRLGLWNWNILTGDLHWSDEHFRMTGYQVGGVAPSHEAWLSRLHPDDRAPTETALRQAMDAHEEYVREFRIVTRRARSAG